jgi:hypothetical protein
MKVEPGSAEAILVDVIKASSPVEPSHFQQRRVLERVLDRQRTHRRSAVMFLRPVVVVGVLLVAGVTAAATFGHGWIARGLRTLRSAAPVEAMAAAPVYRPHRRATEPAEPRGLDPSEAEPEAAPGPAPTLPATRSAPGLAVRSHAARTEGRSEDPSLVVDAIRALRTDHDPRRASTLLGQYLRTYPHGALSEEAVALSIEAAAASRSPSATTFAAQYLREYPHGRFRRTAEQALEQRQP